MRLAEMIGKAAVQPFFLYFSCIALQGFVDTAKSLALIEFMQIEY